MAPVIARLARVLDLATLGLNVAGSVLIVAIMALIGADVLGRGLFGAPVKGVPEMVTLSIVAIVFLQVPQALRAGRLTQSDALLKTLRARAPGAALLLETLFDAAAMGVMGVILWFTWPLFQRSWASGDFIGAVGEFTAPTWPVKLIICVGSLMLILQFAARLLRLWGGERAA
ncbi:MAG: TRAP transporter small permease subunit [Pseudomonadota bacterium]